MSKEDGAQEEARSLLKRKLTSTPTTFITTRTMSDEESLGDIETPPPKEKKKRKKPPPAPAQKMASIASLNDLNRALPSPTPMNLPMASLVGLKLALPFSTSRFFRSCWYFPAGRTGPESCGLNLCTSNTH
ncbi:hypothetical protein HJC23_003142 [Cyclotella cryptica]|uniref:Uncharacterized protein n=1 Tax=Cyclotella cryptica TaxID=29204 RepID=A0ABD3P749_9STRA